MMAHSVVNLGSSVCLNMVMKIAFAPLDSWLYHVFQVQPQTRLCFSHMRSRSLGFTREHGMQQDMDHQNLGSSDALRLGASRGARAFVMQQPAGCRP